MKRFLLLLLVPAFLFSSSPAFASGICSGKYKGKEDHCTGNSSKADKCSTKKDKVRNCKQECEASPKGNYNCLQECNRTIFDIYLKCCCS